MISSSNMKTWIIMFELACKAAEAFRAGHYCKTYRYMLLAGVTPVRAYRRIHRDIKGSGHRVHVAYASDRGYQPWCECGWRYDGWIVDFRNAGKVECPKIMDRKEH